MSHQRGAQITLFDQDGAALDPLYLRLRDSHEASDSEQKMCLDGLWTRARPHLDGNFKGPLHATLRKDTGSFV